MRHFAVCAAVAGALAAIALLPQRASADELTISPLAVHLRPNAPIGAVTLENRGTEPVRVQVSSFAWNESSGGEMMLAPAERLVSFPTLLTVEPGQRRQVKVGFESLAPSAVERTYRVFFLELPPLAPQLDPLAATGPSVKYRTKFGVPVFVDASGTSQAQPRIDGGTYRAGTYAFHLANDGNTHFMATRVAVQARDAAGTVVAAPPLKGWYVLAKGDREYTFALDAKDCARVHDVSVTVDVDGVKGPLVRTLPPPAACR